MVGQSQGILHVRTINSLDGAQPGQVPFQGAALSPDGRLWFANGNALQVLDPSKPPSGTIGPPVQIQDVVAGHKTYKRGEIFFPRENPRFTDRLHRAEFQEPTEVRFRYKLDGRDKDWENAGTRRQAFYTDLPPGQYRFRVIASNEETCGPNKGRR